MHKFATGQILNDKNRPVTKTASAAPLTEDDVQEIEREDTEQPEE